MQVALSHRPRPPSGVEMLLHQYHHQRLSSPASPTSPSPRRDTVLAGCRPLRRDTARRPREDRKDHIKDHYETKTLEIERNLEEDCDTIVGIPPEGSPADNPAEFTAFGESESDVINNSKNKLVSRNDRYNSLSGSRFRCLRLGKCKKSECGGLESWRRWICLKMEQCRSRGGDGSDMGGPPKVAARRGSALAAFLHLLLLILATSAIVRARTTDATRYETAYACEGKTLKIECRDGEVIHLIRANYGRFSITICNDHGNTDWSVNCMSTKSLRVLHTKCSMNQNCSILASTSMFGDPCPNTLKYLEAHYTCIPAATTSSTFRPSPQWLITSQPSVWRSTVPSTSLASGGNSGPGSNNGPGSNGGRPSAAGGGGAHHLAPPTFRPHITMPPDLRPGVIKVKNDGHSPEMAGKPSQKAPPPEVVVPLVTEDVLVETEITDEITSKPKEDGREGFTEAPKKDDSSSAERDRESAAASPPHERDRERDRDQERNGDHNTAGAGEADGGRRHHHHTHHDNEPNAPVLPLWRHCPPTSARSLHWNWTSVGEVAVQPCPGGATGLARWRCVSTAHRLVHLQQQKRLGAPSRETMSGHSSRTPVLLDALGADTLLTGRDMEQIQDMTDFRQEVDSLMLPDPLASSGLTDSTNSAFDVESQGKAVWISESPDLSECRSVWLNSLETRVKEGESLLSISNDLSQVTSSKTLYGGDMMTTTNIMKKLSTRMAQNIKSFPDSRQKEAIVTDLLLGAVKTGSNLLDASQQASWKDLSHPAQMRVATSLLIGLEENAFLLAEAILREKTIVQQVKNILLSVRVLETRNVETEEFPSAIAREQWTASQDSIFLPRGALIDNSEGGLVRIVFVAFDRLEEILQPPAAPPQPLRDESASLGPPTLIGDGAEHPQINKDRDNVTRVINSKVISASLGKGRHIQLSQPVRLTLRHLRTENVTNPTCVFWDYTVNVWSAEGCRVEWTNATHTGCLCAHLTNFALLMDVRAVPLAPAHRLALHLLTTIGCSVSIVALLAAFVVFHCFKGMKSDRTTIHKNLCFCLLVAEVIFMFGIERTDNRDVCGVIAALLHYFFLAAFAWMFLEGFQLYAMLVEVFEPERARARWYYAAAYLAPLIIVVVSGVVDFASYGTERHCWLRADNYFILAFVVPVALVLLANWVCLCMVIYMMCHHSNVSIKTKENNKLYKIKVWLRSSIFLAVVLGLTWTFGLLYLSEETVVFAYLFTFFNSFQGLLIFVCHCLLNEAFQKECGRLGRRHPWLSCCARLAPAPALPAPATTAGGSSSSPPASGSGQTGTTQGSGPLGSGPLGSGPLGSGQKGRRQHDDLRLDDTMDGHQSSTSSKHQPQVMMTSAGTLQHTDHPRRDPNRTRDRHHNTDSVRLQHNAPAGHPRQHHYHPHSHTYSEIGRVGYRRGSEQEFREIHDDPVYEEIERNETLMSDMSDDNSTGHGEAFVRPVDQLGHQAKFYGDHRPLISYSPGDRHRYDRSPVPLEHQMPHGKYNTTRWNDSLERHAERPMYAYHPQDPSNMRTLAAVLKSDNDVTSKVLCPGHGHGTHQRVLPPYSDC